MAILEKMDYTMISGHPFIKNSGVVVSQMDGVHISDVRRNFKNQIMIFPVPQKPAPKTRHARTCQELESINRVQDMTTNK